MAKDLDSVQPASRKAWRSWLQKNHASSPGVWLVYAKKHTGIPSLTYNDAVEEALCFGWIDSLLHPIDDSLYKQIFTPRKETSAWSPLNKKRVERLITDGLMAAAGMRLIEIAKKSGRWNTWDSSDALTMPPELKKALNANAAAKRNWPTYTASQRKAFLRMVDGAKTADTRMKRVARVIEIVSKKISFSQLVKGQTADRAPAQGRARRRR
jgi:uncharacterized protein YdeI (YjbR/CyaY-like superfamily)